AVSSAIRASRRRLVDGGRMIVVLNEPRAGLDASVLAGLVQAIVSEGVDLVLGVAGPQLRLVATGIEASGILLQVVLSDDTAELRSQLRSTLAPGDVVLIQS